MPFTLAPLVEVINENGRSQTRQASAASAEQPAGTRVAAGTGRGEGKLAAQGGEVALSCFSFLSFPSCLA